MNTFLINHVVFCANAMEGLCLALLYVMFFMKESCWSRRRILFLSAVCLVVLYIGSVLGSGAAVAGAIICFPVLLGVLCSEKRLYNFFMVLPALLIYAMLSAFPVYMLELVFDKAVTDIAGVEGFSAAEIAVDVLLLALHVCTFLYCRKNQIDLRLKLSEILLFLVYFLYSVFVVFVLTIFQGYLVENARIAAGFILLLFTVAIFAAFWFYLILFRRNHKLEQDIRETEQLLRTQLAYAESSAEKQEEFGILRHDLKNHLQVIGELCAGHRLAEAERYVRQLLGTPVLEGQLKLTGNNVADIVLAVKREAALREKVEFQAESQEKMLFFLEDVDVCTLLTNLLDNALEAAKTAEHGKISVAYLSHRNYCVLTVSNTVRETVPIRDNRIRGKKRYTGKADKKAHGYGLQGVERIVKKYGGEYTLSCRDHVFAVNVILPRKEPLASE